MGKKKKKAGEHFDELKECAIHTSRRSPKHKRPACESSCDYSKKLQGTLAHDAQGLSQVHHALPVAEVNGYGRIPDVTPDKLKTIGDVYRKTPWCVSHKPNLVRLPVKKWYLQNFVQGSHVGPSPSIVCHNWDHHHYNVEVWNLLKNRIWSKIGSKKEDGTCFDEEDVQQQFTGLETKMQGDLKDRAQRGGSGKKADVNAGYQQMIMGRFRQGNAPNPDDAAHKYWWLSLSMAESDLAKMRKVATLQPTSAHRKRKKKGAKK